MKFDDLDFKMRQCETSLDICVPPGIFMVARLDGRGFTRLTKEIHPFEAPFDPRFRDLMVTTVCHLMNCGFRVVYAFTQSDEISLLFHQGENSFERKLRKLNSVLAGEASGRFSIGLKSPACFDCRISQLPTPDLVRDYFRWRQEDAARNALNAHCYWLLRKEGSTEKVASEALLHLGPSDKKALLFKKGINFAELPTWQKHGVGVYRRVAEKEGFNPKLDKTATTTRRVLHTETKLPTRESYTEFLLERVREAQS